jgi:uncharacterized protein (TIGR00661 family)
MQKSTYNEQELKDRMRNVKQYFKQKKLQTELAEMFTNYLEYYYNQKETKKIGHLTFHPIDNELFSYSLASCAGVITNAGFGTTSEAIYFGKKLCIIPIKKQFEQLCNAKALSTMGALQIKTLNEKSIDALRDWLINGQTLHIDYPDNTELLVNKIFHYHLAHKEPNDRAKLLLQLQQKRISIS